MTDGEMAALVPFFETFPDYPMSSAMCWLFEQPAVQQLIAERIASIDVAA